MFLIPLSLIAAAFGFEIAVKRPIIFLLHSFVVVD